RRHHTLPISRMAPSSRWWSVSVDVRGFTGWPLYLLDAARASTHTQCFTSLHPPCGSTTCAWNPTALEYIRKVHPDADPPRIPCSLAADWFVSCRLVHRWSDHVGGASAGVSRGSQLGYSAGCQLFRLLALLGAAIVGSGPWPGDQPGH